MKRILLIFSIIFISISSYGQIYLGISSGAAITKMRTKDEFVFNFSSLLRFNINLPVLFKLNKNIGFESGISYLNMGSTLTYNFHTIDANDPIYLAYDNIKYHFR